MCVGGAGGGGSVPAARITDSLKSTKQYKKAKQRVQRVRSKQGSMDAATYKTKLKQARQSKKSVSSKYKDKRANNVENDTLFMLDKVKDLLRNKNPLNQAFDSLDQSNLGLQDTLTQLSDLATMAADNQQLLQEDAMRQSLLRGAPPPEDSADAPVIGRNREGYERPGRTRQALRIDRTPSSTLTI
jgi:hypothetical protein